MKPLCLIVAIVCCCGCIGGDGEAMSGYVRRVHELERYNEALQDESRELRRAIDEANDLERRRREQLEEQLEEQL